MVSLPALHVRGMDDAEQTLTDKLLSQLLRRAPYNRLRELYYDGNDEIESLGIATPQLIQDIKSVVGWPGMAVNTLEERLDWQGVALLGEDTDDPLGLRDVIIDNELESQTQQGNLESLIHGCGFVVASRGDPIEGEPEWLITIEPPTRMTGEWSPRQRRLSSALSVEADEATRQITSLTLYLPAQTIFCERPNPSSEMQVVRRALHNLGRVPVEPLINQPRRSRPWGRSEITPALRSYTDSGVRTMLSMEVSREFYSSPKEFILGASESAFTDEQGNPIPAWMSYLGRFKALERDDEGNLPEVQQFSAASPAPYVEQVKLLAQMVAGEASIPESYLGFVSANPSSADAIRATEARLVKRAERRQQVLGRSWANVLRLVVAMRDGGLSADARGLVSRWRDAATPTRAAQADATMKLVGVGVLPPDSDVTYEQLGFDQTTIARLRADVRRRRSERMLNQLTGAAEQAEADEDVAALGQAAAEGAVNGAGVGGAQTDL